ncbi:Hypothetical_protein [Hexamita inflata]|uniref:Hypothetical_protein n=1 Tax=Hexamita inflata TaxID=28002 RepID=A0AA86RL85_9EUKA|nr:Hypothetical protein HINF_LOCUS23500 [Hexamita inflata]CAI9968300.1 Hypothetical protein HINF_LOCUS55945 [Hexamita inflata]CAI9976656.1 Hypothetical protein HINF_LOCUS64301 [Hexamita inflata]
MPFVETPQKITLIDIQPTFTTIYATSEDPKMYQAPCPAFEDGFLTDIAAFAQHAIAYAQTRELQLDEVLSIVVPASISRSFKQYLLQTFFESLPNTRYVRLEYKCSFYLYGQQVSTAVVIEQDQFIQLTPVMNGFIQKELLAYCSQEDLPQKITELYEKVNFFAKKQLSNALLFCYQNDYEDAVSDQVEQKTIYADDKLQMLTDGIAAYFALGNVQEEAFERNETVEQWLLKM